MVIGMDAREAFGRLAGKGRFTHELMTRLPAQAKDDLTFRMYVRTLPGFTAPPNTSWEAVSGKGPLWHRQVANRANAEADLYFATTSYLAPQFLKIPFVLTVYDLIVFNPLAKPQLKAKLIERATLKRAAGKAAAIITISQSTADDLTDRFPETKGKVHVIPLAADDRFRPFAAKETAAVREKFKLPRHFILSTGTIEPRKNLERLVKAFQFLPENVRNNFPLILVGNKGWEYEPVFKAIHDLRLGGQVRHLDYVDDEELARLYAACTVFCYPSLYEGFGLPVLEAMQSGVPVITSNVSSLPEVGGKAVRYVNPAKTAELSKALSELLADPAERKRLSEAGIERAKEFSWETAAARTLEVLRQAARR